MRLLQGKSWWQGEWLVLAASNSNMHSEWQMLVTPRPPFWPPCTKLGKMMTALVKKNGTYICKFLEMISLRIMPKIMDTFHGDNDFGTINWGHHSSYPILLQNDLNGNVAPAGIDRYSRLADHCSISWEAILPGSRGFYIWKSVQLPNELEDNPAVKSAIRS